MSHTSQQRALGAAQIITGLVSSWYGNSGGGAYMLGRGIRNVRGKGTEEGGSSLTLNGIVRDSINYDKATLGGYLGGQGGFGSTGGSYGGIATGTLGGLVYGLNDSPYSKSDSSSSTANAWTIGAPTKPVSFEPQPSAPTSTPEILSSGTSAQDYPQAYSEMDRQRMQNLARMLTGGQL